MNASDLNGVERKMIAATLALRLRHQPFTPDQAATLTEVIAEGIRAASGAVVSIESLFAQQERDPFNSDNYCRLLDWIKKAEDQLKQP